MGFEQVVFFTHDRASDATLELLAAEVLPQL
ncbi:MAG: LLM class flavin-dependent oxidoreductase, partial [Mycolicibacterium aromaticivorans]|nr:LLM class flavin-dependent oxidoreductase [Mycolicibacterium aromaticivorans]